MKYKTYKKKKLENNRFSIIPNVVKEKCYICESMYNLTWHEIYRGRNRDNSMRYGLCLRLCEQCHERYQESKEFNDYWHKEGQKQFMATYPNLDFSNIFKINYL